MCQTVLWYKKCKNEWFLLDLLDTLGKTARVTIITFIWFCKPVNKSSKRMCTVHMNHSEAQWWRNPSSPHPPTNSPTRKNKAIWHIHAYWGSHADASGKKWASNWHGDDVSVRSWLGSPSLVAKSRTFTMLRAVSNYTWIIANSVTGIMTLKNECV